MLYLHFYLKGNTFKSRKEELSQSKRAKGETFHLKYNLIRYRFKCKKSYCMEVHAQKFIIKIQSMQLHGIGKNLKISTWKIFSSEVKDRVKILTWYCIGVSQKSSDEAWEIYAKMSSIIASDDVKVFRIIHRKSKQTIGFSVSEKSSHVRHFKKSIQGNSIQDSHCSQFHQILMLKSAIMRNLL